MSSFLFFWILMSALKQSSFIQTLLDNNYEKYTKHCEDDHLSRRWTRQAHCGNHSKKHVTLITKVINMLRSNRRRREFVY